jgi:hypothetical protein
MTALRYALAGAGALGGLGWLYLNRAAGECSSAAGQFLQGLDGQTYQACQHYQFLHALAGGVFVVAGMALGLSLIKFGRPSDA